MSVGVREGVTRLVGFTQEDKAAKGLRSFVEAGKPQRPIYHTVAEMISMQRALLLHGPRGAGRSILATALVRALTETPEMLSALAIRNPEGDELPQDWAVDGLRPVLGKDAEALSRAKSANGPVLLILDGLPEEAEALLNEVLAWIDARDDARALVLLDSASLDTLRLPANLPIYQLMPLPKAERAARVEKDPVTTDWCEPGFWALCVTRSTPADLKSVAREPEPPAWMAPMKRAAQWENTAPEKIIAEVAEGGAETWAAFAHLARWLGPTTPASHELAERILLLKSDASYLLIAEPLVSSGSDQARDLANALSSSLATSPLASLRRRVGEALSRLGDPRDLSALCDVPAGRYPMGGDLHPNSAPPYMARLEAFRMAAYPVTVRDYAAFAVAENRAWASPSKNDPARQNHPATDLTWHDARAYCDWLAGCWRTEGRIGSCERVRLPTEREWEAAARSVAGHIWPWGDSWALDHANGEETGFNDTCAVGLFAEGASSFGCGDMAGNVWEWCTTLWGKDMVTPSFRFPWMNDGREALDASKDVRRVLRGGCFSSPSWKANGVYRGSLEPAGSWRGNGFRIVVD
jgi:formylglycine-generating enzyme required for sulfatase activity